MIQSASTNQLLLPPEQFYWALLDGSVIQGRSALPQQLGYLLEAVLPVPIEQLQAVYARVDIPDIGTRYLACGMQRDRLESILTASSNQEQLVTLGPERLPEFLIQQIGPDQLEELGPGSLNLLQGQCEPRPIRKLRRRWIMQIGATWLLCASLIVLGLQRRTASIQRQLDDLQQSKASIYRDVFGSLSREGGQPPELRLTAELRRLRQTRQESVDGLTDRDAVPTLAALLASWPSGLFIQTDSLSITPTAMTIHGAAPESALVQKLADALQNVDGWQLGQPQINAARDSVQATLQFKVVPHAMDQERKP